MRQKHKRFRESRTPFPLRDIRKNSSQHVRACAAGDGAICSKNRKIVPYHEANPNTRNGARLRSPSPIMAPDFALFLFFCGFPGFLGVFLVFLGCSGFSWGCSWFFWGVSGFLGVFRVFLGVFLVFLECSGFSWGVPGFLGSVPGFLGVFRVFRVFRNVP